MKNIPIVLMGCGGVGCQLLHRIISSRSLHSKQGLSLRVVGVCDSRSLLVVNDVSTMELSDSLLTHICSAKSSGSPLSSRTGFEKCQIYKDTEAKRMVIDIAGLLGSSTGLVLVDCSASAETTEILKQAIGLGCCIVLANKKPLTCSIEDHKKLMSDLRRIRFEATVGAGLPIVTSITRLLRSGDPIHRIFGSLSGTLGYVMSEVADGKLLSEVVQTAKSLGYTEPDPRDDLSGMDVARKALTIARLLGHRMNLADIKVESLYPEKFGPNLMSIEDFLTSGLPSLDSDLSERARAASLNGNILRYVCMIEGSRCEVGLQEFPRDSPLGTLGGTVEVYSRCYQESPMVIQGSGGGNYATSAGVLADILDLQDLFFYPPRQIEQVQLAHVGQESPHNHLL